MDGECEGMKRIVLDLDDTISFTVNGDYRNAKPNLPLIEKMRTYRDAGFTLVIATSRNMRTYDGNVGLINAKTLPIILEWLERNKVPYDEIITGKPWCGFEGFYVDDKSIRPNEFVALSYEQILEIMK